jgi:N utilization substance protein A
LSEFGLSREQADAMIMAARVSAGWVDEAAVAAAPEEGEAGEAGDEAPAN